MATDLKLVGIAGFTMSIPVTGLPGFMWTVPPRQPRRSTSVCRASPPLEPADRAGGGAEHESAQHAGEPWAAASELGGCRTDAAVGSVEHEHCVSARGFSFQ
jgi:hypothetical protein